MKAKILADFQICISVPLIIEITALNIYEPIKSCVFFA